MPRKKRIPMAKPVKGFRSQLTEQVMMPALGARLMDLMVEKSISMSIGSIMNHLLRGCNKALSEMQRREEG